MTDEEINRRRALLNRIISKTIENSKNILPHEEKKSRFATFGRKKTGIMTYSIFTFVFGKVYVPVWAHMGRTIHNRENYQIVNNFNFFLYLLFPWLP